MVPLWKRHKSSSMKSKLGRAVRNKWRKLSKHLVMKVHRTKGWKCLCCHSRAVIRVLTYGENSASWRVPLYQDLRWWGLSQPTGGSLCSSPACAPQHTPCNNASPPSVSYHRGAVIVHRSSFNHQWQSYRKVVIQCQKEAIGTAPISYQFDGWHRAVLQWSPD